MPDDLAKRKAIDFASGVEPTLYDSKKSEQIFTSLTNPFANLDQEQEGISRVSLLKESSKQANLNLTIIPVDDNGRHGSEHVMNLMGLSTSTESPLTESFLSESGSLSDYDSFNNALSLPIGDQCLLSSACLPKSLYLRSNTNRVSSSLMSSSAVSANILLIAKLANQPVIYFNPIEGHHGQFVLVNTELCANCYEFNDVFTASSSIKGGNVLPIWVTADESNFYVLQNKGNSKEQYPEAVKLFIENEFVLAFSDIFGQGSTFVPPVHSRKDVEDKVDEKFRLRLIPTHTGLSLQKFYSNNPLFDQQKYEHCILAVSSELITLFEASATGKYHFIGTSRAQKSLNLLDTVTLKSSRSEWCSKLEMIIQIARSNSSHRMPFHLPEVRKHFSELQNEYEQESDRSIRDQMFTQLSKIAYRPLLHKIFKPVEQINKWLSQLTKIDLHSVSKKNQSLIEPEVKSSFNRMKNKLKELKSFVFTERQERLINTFIRQFEAKVLEKKLSLEDIENYYTPLKDKLTILRDNFNISETESRYPLIGDSDICELVVSKLNTAKQDEQVIVPPPLTTEDTSDWLRKHGNLGVLSESMRNMLFANIEIVFNILNSDRDSVNEQISKSFGEVRENSVTTIWNENSTRDQVNYDVRDVDLFPQIVRKIYVKVNPDLFVSNRELRTFNNYIPVIQIELLSRLWPSKQMMLQEFRRLLEVFSTKGSSTQTANFSQKIKGFFTSFGTEKKQTTETIESATSVAEPAESALQQQLVLFEKSVFVEVQEDGGLQLALPGNKTVCLNTTLLTNMAQLGKEAKVMFKLALTEHPRNFEIDYEKYRKE
ncbi:hypothetical protein L2734_03850 [Parashewanella spongiae]|uniref:hypothetical protein n=1 Tax=Parashewanella spongiae TaxID=342950 RepID=UPI001059DCB9|nr:hypothetical protein [Parashewanella spongiae]MCL1077312.1 hypothetical protein [Parashewanella spongiae]